MLNDAYNALGFESSTAGSVVGWVMGEGRHNSVDFGLLNVRKKGTRDFINNEYEPYIILDFNVDGVVYDLIDKQNELRRVGNLFKVV